MDTGLFNQKPSKGIAYLQEHGFLETPLDPSEVVVFIKENHKLDKKQVGEFVSRCKKEPILVALSSEALCSWSIPGSADLIKYVLPIDLLYYVGENAYTYGCIC